MGAQVLGSNRGNHLWACNMQTDVQQPRWHAELTKEVSWRVLFFVAAVDVFAGGLIAVVMNIIHPKAIFFTFTSELFLLFFGCVMLIVDGGFIIPRLKENGRYLEAKDNIYKFLLFLTRFTGRGFWYMFLGSMIWAALWDQDENKILGFIMSLYPILLGIMAVGKGIHLSLRLNKVHRMALASKHIAEPMTGDQFKKFCADMGVEF